MHMTNSACMERVDVVPARKNSRLSALAGHWAMDRYEKGRVLGRGTHGTVVQARDLQVELYAPAWSKRVLLDNDLLSCCRRERYCYKFQALDLTLLDPVQQVIGKIVTLLCSIDRSDSGNQEDQTEHDKGGSITVNISAWVPMWSDNLVSQY